MTRAPADIVREAHEFATATGEPAYGVIADDVRWMNAPAAPEAEVYVGHDGVRRCVDNLAQVMEGVRFVVADIFEVGDGAIVSRTQIGGTARESGLEIELRVWTLWVVEGGKIVHAQGFETREAAEAAAEGLG